MEKKLCISLIFSNFVVSKHKAFALTGRLADCHHTQGDALG